MNLDIVYYRRAVSATFYSCFICFKYNFLSKASDAERGAALSKTIRRRRRKSKNILIERNLRLVAHVAKIFNPGKDSEDLISVGTIGLIKGISSYNSEKGTRLSTYIARCIENEILMCIRSSKKNKNEVSIEEPIGFDREGNQITFNDILGSNEDEVLEEVSRKIRLVKLYDGIDAVLKGREKTVVELRYGLKDGKELTQKEVAKFWHIAKLCVANRKRAVGKLKMVVNVYINAVRETIKRCQIRKNN